MDTKPEAQEFKSRVGDYSDLSPFTREADGSRKVEELLLQEIVIEKFVPIEYDSQEGQHIEGLSVLFHFAGEGEKLYFNTFSEVLKSRLGAVPPDQFPVGGMIDEAGSGARKYFTIR